MDLEMSGLVERPWLQLMCCAICLPHGRNFRWRRESPSGSECWMVCRCWIPEIKFNKRLSSSIIRLVNYSVTTSLIQSVSIGDAWGFSVETLTGATPSWKTELNRSISAMEDRRPGGLQHCHKTCCEKGSHHGRRACMVQRWHHRRDVVFQTGGLVYDKFAYPLVIDFRIHYLRNFIFRFPINYN